MLASIVIKPLKIENIRPRGQEGTRGGTLVHKSFPKLTPPVQILDGLRPIYWDFIKICSMQECVFENFLKIFGGK